MAIQGIEQVMGELRGVSALAANRSPDPIAGQAPKVDFAEVLRSSIEQVNDVQQTSQDLQKRFEMGDENVNLHDVMISLQKASLSFQTMVQVRNKLVTAYQEVMNTQV